VETRNKAQLGLAIAVAIIGPLAPSPAPAAEPTQQPPPAIALAPETSEPELLVEARENLRISRLTVKRIERDLAALREQPGVDPTVIRDYVIYLERVKSLTVEHEKVLRSMEGVSNDTTPPGSMGEATEEPEVFRPPPLIVEDELSRLDREFLDSLARFDQYLLDEQAEAQRRMERIEEASSEKMDELAQDAADAVERLRKKGIDVNTKSPPGEDGQQGGGPPGEGEPGESEQGEGEQGDQGEGQQAQGEQSGDGVPGEEQAGAEGEPPAEGSAESNAPPGGQGTEGESPETTGGGVSGTGDGTDGQQNGPAGTVGDPDGETTPPVDRPPADDDDIVARQLREAAERETDPVLKEKLWQEYDKYKAGG
jgi:hypothetical protein